jgi:hypothetical protein
VTDPARRRQLGREFLSPDDPQEDAVRRDDWATGDASFRCAMSGAARPPAAAAASAPPPRFPPAAPECAQERRHPVSLTESVVEGTPKPDGTLELDQKPGLSPGREIRERNLHVDRRIVQIAGQALKPLAPLQVLRRARWTIPPDDPSNCASPETHVRARGRTGFV